MNPHTMDIAENFIREGASCIIEERCASQEERASVAKDRDAALELLYTARMNPYRDVREFHEATGLDVADEPVLDADSALLRLRMNLHREEAAELRDAFRRYEGYYSNAETLERDRRRAIVEMADAICDLIYVLAGTAVSLGIPLEDCWQAVQESNMSKIPEDGVVVRRTDGKILKPDTFVPVDLEKVIFGD